MKIRIQDNAVRYRLTLKEVEALAERRHLVATTAVIGLEGPVGDFRYGIEIRSVGESTLELAPFGMTFILAEKDFATLADPAQEGFYLRREWTNAAGETHRFMAFVEKDRVGATCLKPELWIYDALPDGRQETRPRTVSR